MYSEVKKHHTFENPFFIGTVIDNNDPEFAYRVKVRIEILHDALLDADLPWAAKVGASFMGVGETDILHAVPEVGTKILVMAIGNDPASLVYLGNLYKNSEVTPKTDDYLQCYGIYTKDGDFIKADKIKKLLQLVWTGKIDVSQVTDMKISVNGPVTIVATEKIDATAKLIEVKSNSDINVNASANFNVTAGGNASIKSSGPLNVEAGGPVTIKSTGSTMLSGGVVTIEKGTTVGFNCLASCMFTGATHVSNTSAG